MRLQASQTHYMKREHSWFVGQGVKWVGCVAAYRAARCTAGVQRAVHVAAVLHPLLCAQVLDTPRVVACRDVVNAARRDGGGRVHQQGPQAG